MDNDPDLAGIPREKLAKVFQVLFILSGCDYVSFSGLGKAVFMNVFYQYSTYITGGQEEVCLSDINGDTEIKKEFFSFIKLIGTLYFKKHLPAFVVLRNVQTPVQLYNTLTAKTTDTRHLQWYKEIRWIVSDRICSEDECALIFIYVATLA